MVAQLRGLSSDFPCAEHNFDKLYVFSNSYPTQASGGVGGYQSRQNPFAGQDEPAYEMSDVKDSTSQLSASIITGDTMSAFYSEVISVLGFSSATDEVF